MSFGPGGSCQRFAIIVGSLNGVKWPIQCLEIGVTTTSPSDLNFKRVKRDGHVPRNCSIDCKGKVWMTSEKEHQEVESIKREFTHGRQFATLIAGLLSGM